MTPLRLTVTSLALAALAACGGYDNLEVRNGPQAVHPSTSRLASGVTDQAEAAQITSIQQITIVNVTAPCAAHKTCHHGHHKGHKYDGSRPIVD